MATAMTEVVYIMACNYSYCEPKLPLPLPTHQLVYHADQILGIGLNIRHVDQTQGVDAVRASDTIN